MNRKLKFANTKAVSLIFVTAFFCYFTSEIVLRQYVLSKIGAKQLSIDGILSKLPEGIRENVKRRIAIAKIQDDLAVAKTESDVISALVALARLKSEEELEKTYAEIIEKYPYNPLSASAYLYFFRGDSDVKKISNAEYHAYISKIPEMQRFFLWQSGLTKLKGTRHTPKEAIVFLMPLLDVKPEFNDYQQLYVDFAEFAFQDENKDLEQRARELEDACEGLKTIDQVMFEEEKKDREKNNKSEKK